jgi:hypothetical protein
MLLKTKNHLAFFFTFFALMLLTEKVQAQDGGINGGIKKVTDKLNQGIDRIFNGKKRKVMMRIIQVIQEGQNFQN